MFGYLCADCDAFIIHVIDKVMTNDYCPAHVCGNIVLSGLFKLFMFSVYLSTHLKNTEFIDQISIDE